MNGIQKVVGSIPIVSTKLSLDAIRVPGSFFIEMSDSRFNQSKWTHFAGRVPHKSLPFIGEASSYTDKKDPLPNDRGSDDYLWY